MVFVKVSETYDLSTQTNKLALIGVHTPRTKLVRKTYPGLAMNTKYFRIDHQNVVIACASMQPADPLQVGVEAGDIAPEDLFNPILYKAVTNDSISTIEGRLQTLWTGSESDPGYVKGNQADVLNDGVTGRADDFPVYYSLLANRDGFRTANPQKGLEMRGLKPLCFSFNYSSGAGVVGNSAKVLSLDSEAGIVPTDDVLVGFRAGAKPLPRLPTTYITGGSRANEVLGTNYQLNGMEDGSPANTQIKMPEIQPIYTAAIIIPPSRLHKLYYRMVVETVIEFQEVRPIQDVANFTDMATAYYPEVYHTDYDLAAKSMTALEGQVDTFHADIKKVM